MTSAGTTWDLITKPKQNRRYQPVRMPGKGVEQGDLGNETVACETVCVSPKEIISTLFGLKDLDIWRKRLSLQFHEISLFPLQDTTTSIVHSHEYIFLRNHQFLKSRYFDIVLCKYWHYFDLFQVIYQYFYYYILSFKLVVLLIQVI